jgi:hypothetical protein
MRIREYAPGDESALRALHAAQGFGYEFPDLLDPLFVTKLVLEDDAAQGPSSSLGTSGSPAGSESRIVGAALLRLTAETYLLIDPRAGTPRRRWESILSLHDAAARDAWRKGLSDVHAWLPPRLAKRFGRRLESLGWVRDDRWTPYCKKLTEAGE